MMAMEDRQFIDDFPITASMHGGIFYCHVMTEGW
jgi:hypothetical protein